MVPCNCGAGVHDPVEITVNVVGVEVVISSVGVPEIVTTPALTV